MAVTKMCAVTTNTKNPHIHSHLLMDLIQRSSCWSGSRNWYSVPLSILKLALKSHVHTTYWQVHSDAIQEGDEMRVAMYWDRWEQHWSWVRSAYKTVNSRRPSENCQWDSRNECCFANTPDQKYMSFPSINVTCLQALTNWNFVSGWKLLARYT